MAGEADAPMSSSLSVGQLRSRVSSCVHLPMLFQLAPGAVNDMCCGAVATDDDTVSCIEIFTDGSSLIPKAWPRVAASGGWGVLVSAICDNQRIAVIGMFFGEVTVDTEHPFFCGANSVQIGACEIQAILAALAWCHEVNLEAKSVTLRPDSMYAIGVLDRNHRCISNVQLVRATRQCLENARNKWCVNFQHTKAHQGQWQNELADALAKMGSYSFPSESMLPLSMARWYQNSQTPVQTVPANVANPWSVPFWLQVACLPDPQNVVEDSHTRASHKHEVESECKLRRRRWKVVTANVLTFQPAIEKEAAGFFASGRRLEFEERIANLNVDFAGIQEGRQRSSVIRQVGRYFVVSAAADRGHGGPEAWLHHKHVSNPKHIITLLSDSRRRRLVVRLSERRCQLDLIVLHAPPSGQTSETKNQASLWWENTLQELIALELLPFSILCVDANGRVGSNTCKQIGNAQSQIEDVNGSGLRLLVETLHLLLPQTKIQQQDDWTWRSTQGNKHRIDFLGIAEAVQPQVHSCAPTDVMVFGSGHFQDHRAVVLDFSTVEMTGPQVARQYRKAICDRQLLRQESVQCSLQQWWQATPCLPQGLSPNQCDALLAKWMRCGLSSVAPQTKTKPKQPWMDRVTLDQVLGESTWRRQWFRLQQATLCLKKKFWFSLWRMGAVPVQIAEAHDTLLVQTCLISVQVTLSSKRVRRIVKQARQQWLEMHVDAIAKAANNGDLKPLYQFYRTTKIGPKVATPLFLPSGEVASNPQKVADVWRHHFAKDFDHRIRQVPFERLENVLFTICSQVQSCGMRDDTTDVTGVQMQPQCVDWVDELSQVANTMRDGKAIGIDSIPPEACRVAGKAYWSQLAEIVQQVIKCNRFPDVWKGGIMCGIPRKPRAPTTPEHSRGILISTAPCTLVGKVLNKRVTQAVEATSKSWQIGCRPGFGTELPSLLTMEFLAMCKQQQRPAAILFADLKGAFYHALLEQVVGPYISEVDLRKYFPDWAEEDLREHWSRAMANPLRAAGVSKAWTDLLRQWFTGGWFLVEGDAQPCLHDIGIKPGDTCAAAGFNLFFQQFQAVLRNRLKQANLVTEIPFGQKEIFLSSPPKNSVALDGPTFVDDDTVLLCAECPSQLIDKICEATRIYVDTARKFGLTLNFKKGKTEALVSWGRKGRAQVLAHDAVLQQNGALSLKVPGQVQPLRLVSEYKHVGTWVSSAASPQCDISHKAAGATTAYLQAISTIFAKKQYQERVAYQCHASTG